MFRQRFVGQGLQEIRARAQLASPGFLIVQGFEDLRGDRVLLLLDSA